MGKKLYILNGDGTTDAAGTGSYANSHSVVLRTGGWANLEQSAAVSDVIADARECNVIVSPAPESYDAYAEAGVRCTAKRDGSLLFAATSEPSENLTVNVLVLR